MYNVPIEYTNLIKKNIDSALEDPSVERIAAFDADGTCWFSDVGRDFFEYQIKKNYFAGPSYTWDDYNNYEKKDIKVGLLWLAKILSGFKLEDVRKFGNEFNQAMRPLFIDHQKEIISYLKEKNVKVYIVTASVKWTVEAGALELGIPREDVIGVETEVINGVITDKQKGHMTWAEGKVDGLLEKTNGKKPFFVSGNTSSDVPMMRISTHLRQVIHSAEKEHPIYKSELAALTEAKEKGWHFIDYTCGEKA